MANLTEFTIASSTETKNGSFCNKLVSEVKRTIPGTTLTTTLKRTYYLFTDDQPDGESLSMDLVHFDITEREHSFADEDSGEMMTVTLRYLYLKDV